MRQHANESSTAVCTQQMSALPVLFLAMSVHVPGEVAGLPSIQHGTMSKITFSGLYHCCLLVFASSLWLGIFVLIREPMIIRFLIFTLVIVVIYCCVCGAFNSIVVCKAWAEEGR